MNVSDMLRIAHSISDKVHTISPNSNAYSASQIFAQKHVGALPVLENGHLVGIVSERDLVTKVVAIGLDPLRTKVSKIMTPNPTVVFPKYSLVECLDLMEKGGFRHLPVLSNENQIIGMISLRDITVALIKQQNDLLLHFQQYIHGNR